MASSTNFIEEFTKDGSTLPEQEIIKKKILSNGFEAKQDLIEYEGNSRKKARQLKKSLYSFYLGIIVYSEEKPIPEELREKLESYNPILSENEYRIEEIPKKFWDEIWTNLFKATKKLGITRLTTNAKEVDFGYGIFTGLPFDGTKNRKNRKHLNWYKLLATTKNFARHLRNDIDGLWVITGGNRVGKTTLAMHLASEGDPNKIKEKHFIFNDDDFWHATDNLPKYSWPIVDELSSLFYSKDAMKGEQKSRKKKLKTFAKENMCVIGCDLNWYNLDKEMRSDKVTCNIHIPTRGIFEFYSRNKIDNFEQDKKSGNAIRPSPDFRGNFPDKNDQVWDMYKSLEDKKVTKKGSKKSKEIKEMAEEVKDDIDRYKKEYNNRTYIDKSLIEADFEIGNKKSKQIKKLVEADLGIQ